MRRLAILAACAPLLLFALTARADPSPPSPPSRAVVEAYTRYELLEPGSGKFRILYEVTQTRAGARHFFNPIRKGSVSTDEQVTDLASGRPLRFEIVDGRTAQAEEPDADPSYEYISVTLARPVPQGGEGRILIAKTYQDATSYFTDGSDIVFSRPLGVKRNSVVLPAGYRLVSCNYPSQVRTESDGRVQVSFWNATPAPAPLIVRARKGAPAPEPSSQKIAERAHQDLAIVYSLRDPETHAFDLYHDLTEDRPGMDHHVNVVRAGSKAADPSARILDTGVVLKPEPIHGAAAIAAAHLDPTQLPRDLGPDSDVIVFRFRPLQPHESVRLRISETYTDPERYRLIGDELYWRRSFGRAADAMILPKGWTLTGSSIPAAVTETEDGRTRLDFINGRPDEIDVLVTARRAVPEDDSRP
jgi:hypothetical protein